MKRTIVYAIAAVAAMPLASLAGTFITSPDTLSNRALASCPRAREEFPALTRTAASPVAAAEAAKSSAPLALSPSRLREEYPSLSRSVRPPSTGVQEQRLTARGLAANPRALEENPALARGVKEEAAFQVAPLK